MVPTRTTLTISAAADRQAIHAMARVTLVMCLVALACSSALASDALPSQRQPAVDVRLVPDDAVQELTLTDGSRVYGHVDSFSDNLILFRTIAGVLMEVARTSVFELHQVSGRVVQGEF